MKPVAGRIVHESETQRQHVRLPLPARVEIGGREYGIRDLSSGGVGIKDITGEYKRGQHMPLRLKLPFGSFSLDAVFEAEVQHYSAKEKFLGCVFVNLAAEHISLLNHMLKSYMAGDIVGSGDLLGIASRDNFTRPRGKTPNAAAPDLKRQIPGLLVIGAIGLLITAFIFENLYTGLFVVKASDAVVAGPVVDIAAPVNGIYHAKLDPALTLVRPGQAIGTLAPSGGASVEIASPCDCYIVDTRAGDGGYIAAGQPVIRLMPVDAKPWILADVDPQQASKITAGAKAAVSVFGAGAEYAGRVTAMQSGMLDGAGGPVRVKITTDAPIPVDLTNRPATVVFSLH